MCGIAGIYHFKGEKCEISDLKQFAAPLNHRGPDAEGFMLYNKGRLGFAHKRLSILDLSPNGAQPMASSSKRYSIVFNGEIFNFIEIRKDLNLKGYKFKSDTDTEVILASFEEWGNECFNKFNGMWAIAIFDHLTNNVILSRDRFGIKPLYYKHFGSFFAFASETNCFKHIKAHPRSFDFENIKRTIADPYFVNSIHSSIFEGIDQLRPGHIMQIDANGVCETLQFYDFHANCASQSDISYTPGDFKYLFEDAVRLRLRSDVPIGTAFSGGLDSTAVFSIIKHLASTSKDLSRLPKKWQTAFCMVMNEDSNINDLPFAQKALKELNSEAIYIETDQHNLFDQIIQDHNYYDDIIGTPLTSITPIYQSMKTNGYTVSMDGHGADEYLYGYRGMVSDLFYKSLNYKGKGYVKRIRDGLVPMYLNNEQAEINDKLNRIIKNHYGLSSYFKRLVRNTFVPESPEKSIVYSNIFSSPLPSLLKTFDKAAMLNSVEIRMPFMDYRLIEMCYNLHNNFKIRDGKTKWILRNELKDILPQSTLDRTYKIGVQAPVDHWLNGQHKNKFNEIINNGPNNDLIHEIGKHNISKWSLINLQLIKL